MRQTLSTLRAAVDRYNMIEQNDKLAVGVSGGKDSVLLLCALGELRRFYPNSFELCAITLDMRFGGVDGDFSRLQQLCDKYSIEYVIERTELADVIFNIRREANPCSLCARMRRGALHDSAKRLGCNKLALGHHLDDAAQTMLMNLLNEGRIGCFSPVTYLSRKDITVIRPFVFTRERDIENAVNRLSLPIVKSKCPADRDSDRRKVGELLKQLDRDYTNVTEKITGALQRGEIDRW